MFFIVVGLFGVTHFQLMYMCYLFSLKKTLNVKTNQSYACNRNEKRNIYLGLSLHLTINIMLGTIFSNIHKYQTTCNICKRLGLFHVVVTLAAFSLSCLDDKGMLSSLRPLPAFPSK